MRELFLKRFQRSAIFFILCIGIMMLFVGCAHQDADVSQASDGKGVSVLWRENGMVWKAPMSVEIEGDNPYTEIAYGSVTEPEPNFSYESKGELYDYWQNNQYTLTNYRLASGNRYILSMRKGSATESQVLELTFLQELPKGSVAALDVVSAEDIALLYAVGTEEASQYLLLHLDSQGQLVSQMDMTEVYSRQDLTTQDFSHGRWYCDEAGNSYILAQEGQRIVIFGTEGKVLFSKGLAQDGQEWLKSAFHCADGSLIMWQENSIQGATKLLWYDTEKKQLRELVTLECMGIKQFHLTEDGMMYYIVNSNLWCWNIKDGSHENLYSLMGGVVPNSFTEYVAHISFTEEENLLLYIISSGGLEYCLLSNEPQQEGIRLVDMMGQFYISGRVTAFNREHPESKIKYENAGLSDANAEEELWKRTLAELAAGKGPDIICMFISDERIDVLYEKGILADLSEVLPEAVETQIFPALLDAGTKDDRLIGICPEALANVLVTADKVWEKEHWSQTEALELVTENPDLEGIYYSGGMSPLRNFNFLATYHVENSPWIDWNTGESHFEKSDFKKVLEVAKEHGEKTACKEDEKVEFLAEGAYLATKEIIFSEGSFPQLMEKYGEDFHFIGYPGQEDYVGYWNSGYLVMVNQKTDYWEECKEFLNFIMAEENLWYTSSSPSREDVIRNRERNMWGGWYLATEPDFSGGYNFTKPDGTSYLEDYISVLKKLGPQPETTYIATIIEEEAQAYFEGGADLERAVEVIDSRVQLYLDERN